jgi:hypothetical protein
VPPLRNHCYSYSGVLVPNYPHRTEAVTLSESKAAQPV